MRILNKIIIALMFISAGAFIYARPGTDDKIKVLDKQGVEQLINNRNGKVLFLNLWATWCVPCREEIPDIEKLHKEYKDKIDVAGLSIDYPDEIQSKILPFVKSQKLTYEIYVNGIKSDEELINMLNKDWNGALPVTLIYDPKGNREIFLEGKKSYSEFKKAVETVLKQ